MTLIDANTFTAQTVNIDPLTTQDEWAEIHRSILLCKQASSKWLKQSRAFGTEKWGEEYVASAEVQMEMALGIEDKPKPANLNPDDKSRAIIMIEGISQSFIVWQRKMQGEIEGWDRPRLQKFLDLVGPVEEQARRVRELLGA